MSDSRYSKRFRVPVSCSVCRKRKSRCDRVKPVCGTCKKKSIAHLCTYEDDPPTGQQNTTTFLPVGPVLATQTAQYQPQPNHDPNLPSGCAKSTNNISLFRIPQLSWLTWLQRISSPSAVILWQCPYWKSEEPHAFPEKFNGKLCSIDLWYPRPPSVTSKKRKTPTTPPLAPAMLASGSSGKPTEPPQAMSIPMGSRSNISMTEQSSNSPNKEKTSIPSANSQQDIKSPKKELLTEESSSSEYVSISIGSNILQIELEDTMDSFSAATNSLLVEGEFWSQQGPLSYVGLTKSDPFIKLIRSFSIEIFKSDEFAQFIRRKKPLPGDKSSPASAMSGGTSLDDTSRSEQSDQPFDKAFALEDRNSEDETDLLSGGALLTTKIKADEPNNSLPFPSPYTDMPGGISIQSLSGSKSNYYEFVQAQVISVLPNKRSLYHAVSRYFKFVASFVPILHEQTFMSEVRSLFGGGFPDFGDGFYKSFFIRDEQDLNLTAQLLLILRLGYMSLIPTGETDIVFTKEEKHLIKDITRFKSDHYLSIINLCISEEKVQSRSTFKIVQSLTLLYFYRSVAPNDCLGISGADSQLLFGSIVNHALSIGLNRDPANYDSIHSISKKADFVNTWRSLWHFITNADAMGAMLCGSPLKIPTIEISDVETPKFDKNAGEREELFYRTQDICNSYRRVINKLTNLHDKPKVIEVLRETSYLEGIFLSLFGQDFFRDYICSPAPQHGDGSDAGEKKKREECLLKVSRFLTFLHLRASLSCLYYLVVIHYEEKLDKDASAEITAGIELFKIFIRSVVQLVYIMSYALDNSQELFGRHYDFILTSGIERSLIKTHNFVTSFFIRLINYKRALVVQQFSKMANPLSNSSEDDDSELVARSEVTDSLFTIAMIEAELFVGNFWTLSKTYINSYKIYVMAYFVLKQCMENPDKLFEGMVNHKKYFHDGTNLLQFLSIVELQSLCKLCEEFRVAKVESIRRQTTRPKSGAADVEGGKVDNDEEPFDALLANRTMYANRNTVNTYGVLQEKHMYRDFEKQAFDEQSMIGNEELLKLFELYGDLDACRKRKVKCDRKFPCSTCVQHNRSKDCSYGESVSTAGPPNFKDGSVGVFRTFFANGPSSSSPRSKESSRSELTFSRSEFSGGSDSLSANASLEGSSDSSRASDPVLMRPAQTSQTGSQMPQQARSGMHTMSVGFDSSSPMIYQTGSAHDPVSDRQSSDRSSGSENLGLMSDVERLKSKIRQLENKLDSSSSSDSPTQYPNSHENSVDFQAFRNNLARGPPQESNSSNPLFVGVNPYNNNEPGELIDLYDNYSPMHVKDAFRRQNFGPFAWLAFMKKDKVLNLLFDYMKTTRASDKFPDPYSRSKSCTKPNDMDADFRKKALDREGDSDVAHFKENNSNTTASDLKMQMNKHAISLGLTMFEGEWDQKVHLIEKIKMLLPTRKALWILINRFFSSVYPFIPIIDETWFRSEIKRMLGPEIYDDERIQHIVLEKQIDLATIAILLIVIRFAYLSAFSNIKAENERVLTATDDSPLAEMKYILHNPIALDAINLSQVCIDQFDLFKRTNMTVLQYMALLRVYYQFAPEHGDGYDGGVSHVLPSMCVSIAYCMGLNREPGNFDDVCNDAKMNNITRKLWFFIKLADLTQAYQFGFPMLIDNNFNDVRLPYYRPGNSNILDANLERDLCDTLAGMGPFLDKLKTFLSRICSIRNCMKMSDATALISDFELSIQQALGSLTDYSKTPLAKNEFTFAKSMKCKTYLNLKNLLLSLYFHFFLNYERNGNHNLAFFYMKKYLAIACGEILPEILDLIKDKSKTFDPNSTLPDLFLTPSIELFLHKTNQLNISIFLRMSSAVAYLRSDPVLHNRNIMNSFEYKMRYAKLCKLLKILEKFIKFGTACLSKLSHRYYYAWRVCKAHTFIIDVFQSEAVGEYILNNCNSDRLMTDFTAQRLDELLKIADSTLWKLKDVIKEDTERKNEDTFNVPDIDPLTINPTATQNNPEAPQEPLEVFSTDDAIDIDDLRPAENVDIDNLWRQIGSMKYDIQANEASAFDQMNIPDDQWGMPSPNYGASLTPFMDNSGEVDTYLDMFSKPQL
ncbi:uncharacterized protein CXQ87_000727 [Candidozyma duobushaemuli]|uniref:Zn(2)-C6 fungal-type domain-containing protein n=1 Tax=Candidozyma duobushaemuli TaxID=1231522 RepID=A0A2V1AIR4_9ASCO|nr:uncharacterized protein CXQ87_000727 [[Candida] duobushaemulonis]PVH17829.1 hypothetical protein CXQ87_000727 [[Candida] duobushaemulonis]